MKTIVKVLPVLAVASALALPASAEAQTSLDSPQAYFDYDFLVEQERVPLGAPRNQENEENGTYGYLVPALGSGSTGISITSTGGGGGETTGTSSNTTTQNNTNETNNNENETQEQNQTTSSTGETWEEGENYRTVPEPATVLLMAFGTLGLGWASKRRNREGERDDA